MKFNTLQSGIANVLALINVDNAQAFTLEQISISAPAVYVDETGVNPRNTQIVITALAGSGMVGSQTHRFTRLDLASLSAEAIAVQLGEDSTLEQIKAQVVAQLAVSDAEVSFSVTEMPTFAEGDQVVIQLVANEGSYGYIGQVDVTLNKYVPEPVQLSALAPNQDLNGFEY